MSIKVNISGIRGTYAELNPTMIVNSAQAFSTYIGKGKILIGSDNRPSGRFIIPAIISGLQSCGSEVINCGIVPTPILQFLIKEHGFDGGISVSGGHNMFNWNSLILLNAEGSYFNYLEGEELFNIYHSRKYNEQNFENLGDYKDKYLLFKSYFNKLKREVISGRKLKFIIDCSNGFNSNIIKHLSEALDITFVPIFCDPSSWVDKGPEPNIRNASILSTVVKESNCDGGFFLNSDGSRILVVDENGTSLSEELTLPIFAHIILSEKKTDIITNYSTSKVIDKIGSKYGVKVFRTDIGQSHVMQMVGELKTLIGGEGNGSIAYSPFSMGFDSFIFIKYLTGFLRKYNMKLSSLAEKFPNPNIQKETIYIKTNNIFNKLEEVGKLYPDKKMIKDGFYVEDGDNWLCVRSSATLSMIRIIGEGKDISDEFSRVNGIIK